MKSKVKMFPVINDMLPFSDFADIERDRRGGGGTLAPPVLARVIPAVPVSPG